MSSYIKAEKPLVEGEGSFWNDEKSTFDQFHQHTVPAPENSIFAPPSFPNAVEYGSRFEDDEHEDEDEEDDEEIDQF